MTNASESNITAEELFKQSCEILDMTVNDSREGIVINRKIHSLLSLTCQSGLKNKRQAFGNLFAQVDFLCKEHHVKSADIIEIQNVRRRSNSEEPIVSDDIPYYIRALSIFISAVMNADIPHSLLCRIPVKGREQSELHHIDYRKIRCIVKNWDEKTVHAAADEDGRILNIDITDEKYAYIQKILKAGMQLNLIGCSMINGQICPQLIVVEPDFLVDISSIARCFTDYGHHPLAYTVNRMGAVANSQAILIGGFSGAVLDDIINKGEGFNWKQTLNRHFRRRALEYCSCKDFNAKSDFKVEAVNQVNNIKQIVDYLFSQDGEGLDRSKAVLEPSFVCESLGLVGRTDLMTTDFKLLVEQKSGKNFNIQINRVNEFGSFQREDHYVQLLLYYGVLLQNFHLSYNKVDLRLLYSKYPLPGGLVVVNFYQKLFNEAVKLRNCIVADEMDMAVNGFDEYVNSLSPETLNERHVNTVFYNRFLLPQILETTAPLHDLSPLEQAYFNRMMTFIYQEEVIGKIGSANGITGSEADSWNLSTTEKREAGNIYTYLSIKNRMRSDEQAGFDTITLKMNDDQKDDFLPNFRRGDMVYLYSYRKDKEPDVCSSMLYKGTLTDIKANEITVHLNDGQQNPDIFAEEKHTENDGHSALVWAVEHGNSDVSYTAAIRSLHAFITSSQSCRDLLLARREPQKDERRTLSKHYNDNFDDILLREKQSLDYFLLIGPPGTGKTSMALRYFVEEELTEQSASILLMAYTNRAVDEICSMLENAGIDYLRIGNMYSADDSFHKHFIDNIICGSLKLKDIKQKIIDKKVVVGTTSSILSHTYLFEIKRFTLTVVDEASQILEPNIIGLLNKNRFVLIGDYKQLPAVVQQNANVSAVNDKQLNDICLYNCRDSLFERLIKVERKAGRNQFIGVLRKQGRMHPDVADFPNKMFYASECLEPVPCPHQKENDLHYDKPSEDMLDDVLKKRRMIFIPSEPCGQTNLSDNVNPDEAKIVADLLRRIYRFTEKHFDPDKTVGVIIPYRNQIAMIRNEIEKLNLPALKRISIDTIERYQGSQRDVIIFSFTVQHRYQLDFLTNNCFEENGRIIDRKLNVALTRARCQMIMTGNRETLLYNNIYKQLIENYIV